jgi:hypothetical protein
MAMMTNTSALQQNLRPKKDVNDRALHLGHKILHVAKEV